MLQTETQVLCLNPNGKLQPVLPIKLLHVSAETMDDVRSCLELIQNENPLPLYFVTRIINAE